MCFSMSFPNRTFLSIYISRHHYHQPRSSLFFGTQSSLSQASQSACNWLHKNIRSESILFFPASSSPGSLSPAEAKELLSRPYLSSFTFSRLSSPTEISEQPSLNPNQDIYRHPQALGDPSTSFGAEMDLYSLGCVFIEIAEWRRLKSLVVKYVDIGRKEADVSVERIAGIRDWLRENKVENGAVGFRMGERFERVVNKLIGVDDASGVGDNDRPDDDSSSETVGEKMGMLQEVVRELQRCVV
jgi:hypothetical protein